MAEDAAAAAARPAPGDSASDAPDAPAPDPTPSARPSSSRASSFGPSNPSGGSFSQAEEETLESALWDMMEQVKSRGIMPRFGRGFRDLDDGSRGFIDKNSFTFLLTKKFKLRLGKKALGLMMRRYQHREFDDQVAYPAFVGDVEAFMARQDEAVLKVQCGWRTKQSRDVLARKREAKTAAAKDLAELAQFLESELQAMRLKAERLQFTLDKLEAVPELQGDDAVQAAIRTAQRMLSKSKVKGREVAQLKRDVDADDALGQTVDERISRYKKRADEVGEGYRRMVEEAVEQGERLPGVAMEADVRRLVSGWRALRGLMAKDIFRYKMPPAYVKAGRLDRFRKSVEAAEADMLYCAGVPRDKYDRDEDETLNFALGIQMKQRKFFSFHPRVNDCLEMVRDAARAAARSEKGIRRERERRNEEQNQISMRCEELEQRRRAKLKGDRERIKRNHRKFIQLSKRWWATGRADRHAREEDEKREAELKALDDAAAQQRKIDEGVENPWAGARAGVSNDRMLQLLDEEALRQRHQEGRTFRIDSCCKDTGDRVLHNACWAGHLRLVKLLVDERGADVNRLTDCVSALTPLHVAARAGDASICDFLVARGARLDARDLGGDTPLHWAARRDHRTVVEALTRPSLFACKRGEWRRRKDAITEYHRSLTARNARGRLARELTTSDCLFRMLEGAEAALASRHPSLFAGGSAAGPIDEEGDEAHMTPKQRALARFKRERDAALRKRFATKKLWRRRREKEQALRMARMQLEIDRAGLGDTTGRGDYRRTLLSSDMAGHGRADPPRGDSRPSTADSLVGSMLLATDGGLKADAKMKI
jgi:hypothetical protein